MQGRRVESNNLDRLCLQKQTCNKFGVISQKIAWIFTKSLKLYYSSGNFPKFNIESVDFPAPLQEFFHEKVSF